LRQFQTNLESYDVDETLRALGNVTEVRKRHAVRDAIAMFMLSAAVRENQPGRIIDASVALLAVKAGGGAVHYRHVPLEQFVRLLTTMSTELMLQHQATMVVNNGKTIMELDEAQELKIAKLKRRAERVRKATFAVHCVRSGADDVLQELNDEFELLAGYSAPSGDHVRSDAYCASYSSATFGALEKIAPTDVPKHSHSGGDNPRGAGLVALRAGASRDWDARVGGDRGRKNATKQTNLLKKASRRANYLASQSGGGGDDDSDDHDHDDDGSEENAEISAEVESELSDHCRMMARERRRPQLIRMLFKTSAT